MTDPRERVETPYAGLSLRRIDDTWQFYPGGKLALFWETWVEIAETILAADAQWREQNAPSLAELRERYPDNNFAVERIDCGPTYCDVAWVERDGGKVGNHFASERDALEWLAAELAKTEAS